jgi:hypothetical protein
MWPCVHALALTCFFRPRQVRSPLRPRPRDPDGKVTPVRITPTSRTQHASRQRPPRPPWPTPHPPPRTCCVPILLRDSPPRPFLSHTCALYSRCAFGRAAGVRMRRFRLDLRNVWPVAACSTFCTTLPTTRATTPTAALAVVRPLRPALPPKSRARATFAVCCLLPTTKPTTPRPHHAYSHHPRSRHPHLLLLGASYCSSSSSTTPRCSGCPQPAAPPLPGHCR